MSQKCYTNIVYCSSQPVKIEVGGPGCARATVSFYCLKSLLVPVP